MTDKKRTLNDLFGAERLTQDLYSDLGSKLEPAVRRSFAVEEDPDDPITEPLIKDFHIIEHPLYITYCAYREKK